VNCKMAASIAICMAVVGSNVFDFLAAAHASAGHDHRPWFRAVMVPALCLSEKVVITLTESVMICGLQLWVYIFWDAQYYEGIYEYAFYGQLIGRVTGITMAIIAIALAFCLSNGLLVFPFGGAIAHKVAQSHNFKIGPFRFSLNLKWLHQDAPWCDMGMPAPVARGLPVNPSNDPENEPNKPFAPSIFPEMVTCDSPVMGAIFPTLFGVWADGWNVQSFLLRTRASYYTAPYYVPLNLDSVEHGGSLLAGATSKLVSLGLQFLPFGLIVGKFCEYMNEIPIAYFGSMHTHSYGFEYMGKKSVCENRLLFEPPNKIDNMLQSRIFTYLKPLASLMNFLLFCLVLTVAVRTHADEYDGETAMFVFVLIKALILFAFRVKFVLAGDPSWSKEHLAERITHMTEDRDVRHRQEIIFLDEVARMIREEYEAYLKPFLPKDPKERMRADVAKTAFKLVKFCSMWEARYTRVAKRMVAIDLFLRLLRAATNENCGIHMKRTFVPENGLKASKKPIQNVFKSIHFLIKGQKGQKVQFPLPYEMCHGTDVIDHDPVLSTLGRPTRIFRVRGSYEEFSDFERRQLEDVAHEMNSVHHESIRMLLSMDRFVIGSPCDEKCHIFLEGTQEEAEYQRTYAPGTQMYRSTTDYSSGYSTQ